VLRSNIPRRSNSTSFLATGLGLMTPIARRNIRKSCALGDLAKFQKPPSVVEDEVSSGISNFRQGLA